MGYLHIGFWNSKTHISGRSMDMKYKELGTNLEGETTDITTPKTVSIKNVERVN